MHNPSPLSSLDEEQARQKLQRMDQMHLLEYWPLLNPIQQERLLFQISHLDGNFFTRQKAFLHTKEPPRPSSKPPRTFFASEDRRVQEAGQEWIKKGKCACVFLAGGQGSRLRFPGPKGCVPVSVVKHKSLFQIAMDKVKAASRAYQAPLEVAIMTSPLNHVETITFFEEHSFFGLSPSQVHFFYQELWPLLNFEEDLFLEAPDQIALGPNGNGGVFRHLVASPIWQEWEKKSIETITVSPIDNPLADPFDATFIGWHIQERNRVTLKAILREKAEEKVGILVEENGKVVVIEYSELSEELRWKKEKEKWLFPFANSGLFCFSRSFFEEVQQNALPLHVAKKAVKMLNSDGISLLSEKSNAWKFEEFHFDALPLSQKTGIYVCPRNRCFAPLKNLEGEDSINTVQKALQAEDRRVFVQISGISPPPDTEFELSQEFYYPTEELHAHWKGKKLPENPYIGVL